MAISKRMRLFRRIGLFGDLAAGMHIDTATGAAEIREALRLVHDVFVEQGYITPTATGVRIRIWDAVPGAMTFVARAQGRGDPIVGVQCLIPDSGAGLPCDEAFGAELDALRTGGRRILEAANEAVAKPYRHGTVATNLMRRCLAHAAATGHTDIVTAVSPEHAAFYEFMRFDVLAGPRSFTPQIDDPVVLVRLDVAWAMAHLAGVADADDSDDGVFRQFYLTGNPYMAGADG